MEDSKNSNKHSNKNFHFSSQQKYVNKGKKTVRKVVVRGGKGFKSVSNYHKGKHIYTAKKPLNTMEIAQIKLCKFIPGLFKDCPCNKTRKRRKHKKQ